MKFFRTSVLLLVAAVFVAGQRDFFRNFDGSSSRFLNDDTARESDGIYGMYTLPQDFIQDFGGQSASYYPSNTGNSNQDGGFIPPNYYYKGNSNKNYRNDNDRSSTSQKAQDASNSHSNGFRGFRSNLPYDSKISSGSRNKDEFSDSSTINAGFGSSAFERNHNNKFGFGLASFDKVSHIPFFPLSSAFNGDYAHATKVGLSGTYPEGNGFGLFGSRSSTSRSSASGASVKASGSSENNRNSVSNGFYRFGGSHIADSSSSASSNNRNDGLFGSSFRGNLLADQNNSANSRFTGSSNLEDSTSGSIVKARGSSENKGNFVSDGFYRFGGSRNADSSSFGFSGSTVRGNRLEGQNNSANYGLTGSSTGNSSSDSKINRSSFAQENQASSGSLGTQIVETTTTTTESGNGDGNQGYSGKDYSSSNATGSSNSNNSASESTVKTRGSSENNRNSVSDGFYHFGVSRNDDSSSSSSSNNRNDGFSESSFRGNRLAGQNNSANNDLTGSSTGISSSDSKSNCSSVVQENQATSESLGTKIVETTTTATTTESGYGDSNQGYSGNDYSSFTATTASPYYQGRGSSFGGLGGYGINSASSSASSSASIGGGAFSTSSSRANAPLFSVN